MPATLVKWYWNSSWKNPSRDDQGDSDLKYAQIGNEFFLAVEGKRRMIFHLLSTPPTTAHFLSSSYIDLETCRVVRS